MALYLTTDTIVDTIRELTGWTSTAQVSNALIYKYLNIEYQKCWQKIVDLDDNYRQQIRFTNLIAGQNEYTFAQSFGTTFGQSKVEEVSIKYSNEFVYYNPAQIWVREMFYPYDPEYYEVNRRRDQPIVVISDQSLFIYPTPKVSFANGLKMWAYRKPYELTTWMNSADILIPDEFMDVLVWAVRPYVYALRQLTQEKWAAYQEYLEKEQWMLRTLSTRKTKPAQGIRDEAFLQNIQ